MATVLAVCTSAARGTRKQAIPIGTLKENFGFEDDAHADSRTHRQVSLLAMESIATMQARGLDVGPGDFAENITTTGIVVHALPVGARLNIGAEAVVEVTQIGKECHAHCAIFEQAGTCVMPLEGIFVRVVRGGPVKAGDGIRLAGDMG